MEYKERKFELPALVDISKQSVDGHLELYAGYVKNFNAISAAIEGLLSDPDLPAQAGKNALAIAELRRRHPFEFDGMKLHEYYFSQFEGGPALLTEGSALAQSITRHWGSTENAVKRIIQTGMMRGPGWSILYFNPESGMFHMGFIGEQHQGHFATLPIILALDVWEHAYLLDYGVSGKAKYIDAFFKNLNWSVMEQRFAKVTS